MKIMHDSLDFDENIECCFYTTSWSKGLNTIFIRNETCLTLGNHYLGSTAADHPQKDFRPKPVSSITSSYSFHLKLK